MKLPQKLIILCVFICNHALYSHGFGKDIFVSFANDTYQSIDNLCRKILLKKSYPLIITYDEKTHLYSSQKIKAIGESKTNCYCNIGFSLQRSSVDITCTPDQEFYLPALKKWIPAYQLTVGDELLSKNDTL